MLPTLRDGDLLLVRYGARVRPGALVVARFARRHAGGQACPGAAAYEDGRAGWWLVSDNPDEGVDSRHRGPVAADQVLGVVRLRVWPSPRMGRRPVAPVSCASIAAMEQGMDPLHPHAGDPVFDLHVGGKMEIVSTVALTGPDELSLAYTPGVARVCEAIAADPSMTQHYTWVPNTVAVVTDGTAVLGLGDIGPAAAMPVMEGKAVLFKQFGGVDAVPICLDTTDVEEIIETVVRLAPSFGGINLEDISAPRCFEIEARLKERLDIPVFHDDQHGTAVVALAALTNALRLTGRDAATARVVVQGAGAAGVAVARILLEAGVRDIAVLDRQGVLNSERADLTAGQGRPGPRHRRRVRSPRATWPT